MIMNSIDEGKCMNIKDKIIEAVFRAVDELNQMLPPDKKVAKSLDVELVGNAGVLDSLALVNFIVEAEQQVEETFGVTLNLADQRAMTAEQNPIQSIGALVDYIASLVDLDVGA
jgi:acyl carrier protein